MERALPERRLSKSRYLQGLQCPKQLWWRVHEPEAPELVPDLVTRAAFEQGHRVGARARRQVPGGVLVNLPHDSLAERVVATQRTLALGAPVVYEGSFLADSTYVAVDILERRPGGFALIEVKSTTQVKAEHLPDVAVQAHVVQRSGLEVERVEIMRLDPNAAYPDLDSLFVREDVTTEIEPALADVPANLERLLQVLDGPLPRVAIGPHCRQPYPCPFLSRCWGDLPRHHVTTLHGIGARAFELIADGHATLPELPEDLELAPVARRQVNAVREGRMVVEPGLPDALQAFEPPIAYLDFETVGPAIPTWRGCHPYEAIPVQFSCRLEAADGRTEKRDWLAESGEDPREEIAWRVVEACRGARTVVAYYSSFEEGCLRRLEQAVPALAAELAEVRGRLRDLYQVVRDHVYHPDFGGSLSLKAVAPALAPEVRYADSAIADGTEASVWLARLLLDGVPDDLFERARVREGLRRYCALDTWATQMVMARLRELARTGARAGEV